MDVQFPKVEFSPEQRRLIEELLKMQEGIKPDVYNGIKYPKKK